MAVTDICICIKMQTFICHSITTTAQFDALPTRVIFLRTVHYPVKFIIGDSKFLNKI